MIINYLLHSRKSLYIVICILLISFSIQEVKSQEREFKNVLYINSYGITYSWGDSVAKGVIATFETRPDIHLYVEYLDVKRFGSKIFNTAKTFLSKKYKDLSFDAVILSDNDALDFFIMYGDSIAPNIPVIFCGVNNPEDYMLENTRFYGIKEGVDQDSVIRLVTNILPDVKKLYFLTDQTTTSIVNLKYIKSIETKYMDRVQFVYYTDISVDSILKVVPTFDKQGAIALIDIFQDIDLKPINPDVLNQEIAKISPVPIIIDSETSLGKGILGGIINKGVAHGSEAAKLALKFIDNPGYHPKFRVVRQEDHYYFDYKILEKFNIDRSLLPKKAIIENAPSTVFLKYLKYILGLIFIAALLIVIIFYLVININRRRKAEHILNTKLEEINDKNLRLKETNEVVNNMNSELEELNENLSMTNAALMEAKQKAEEADVLKSSFLANMSHEIRTPLNAIVGFSNLSTDPTLSDENREYFAHIIRTNSDQLLNLIDDILDFSKIEANQLSISSKIFSVQDLCFDLYTFINHNNVNSNVSLRIADFVKNENLMLNSDETRIKQIFINLISNALKFTNEGFVEFGYKMDDKNVPFFYVKDTGIGIEAQNLEHIFDRFWKFEGYDNKYYSGTGLGLAISKKLVHLLGGDIWVESEINKGTTFYFTIPNGFLIKNMPEEAEKTEFLGVEYFDWSSYSVAIAEDEEYNLKYLVETLKKTRIKILTFQNGLEIVDFFANKLNGNTVHLVLMDIKMPKMDGFEAMERIKEMHPHIPIIAQTAYAMASDIKKIQESNFDNFVSKPIKVPVLLDKMNFYLEKVNKK